jgi:hypothetical protein
MIDSTNTLEKKRILLSYPFPSPQTTENLEQSSEVGVRDYNAALRHGGPGHVYLSPDNLKELEMGTMLTDTTVAWRLKHIAATLPPELENKVLILSSFMGQKLDNVIF